MKGYERRFLVVKRGKSWLLFSIICMLLIVLSGCGKEEPSKESVKKVSLADLKTGKSVW